MVIFLFAPPLPHRPSYLSNTVLVSCRLDFETWNLKVPFCNLILILAKIFEESEIQSVPGCDYSIINLVMPRVQACPQRWFFCNDIGLDPLLYNPLLPSEKAVLVHIISIQRSYDLSVPHSLWRLDTFSRHDTWLSTPLGDELACYPKQLKPYVPKIQPILQTNRLRFLNKLSWVALQFPYYYHNDQVRL